MGESLLLAVIFVYLILAAQFESFIDPLSIMLSLPLAIVGMAGTLLLTGDTLSIMSFIGLILLMGLVTKNAILLVDYTKVLRRQGMDRRTALVTAGRTRLRPIMMTTLAMIFGMLPLALGIGQGAEMRAPMGRAVIGGLITSTVLTLLVVPVVYSLFDDFAYWLHRRWAGSNAPEQDQHARAARIAVGILLLGTLAFPARADEPRPAGEPPAAVRILALEDAVRIATEKNRDVQKARAYQEWVQGKYVEERAGALPHLSAQATAAVMRDEATRRLTHDFTPASTADKELGVTLNQALFTWGKVGAALRAARSGIASADDQLEHYRQAAVRAVTEAFYDVLFSRRLQAIARETLAQRERQLADAEQRHRLGTATDYDLLAARVALANQKPEVLRSEGLVAVALDRLRVVLAEETQAVDATGSLEAEPEVAPALDEAVRTAREHRPDLRALVHAVEVRQEVVKVFDADDKPRLDLRAGAGYRWLDVGPGPYSAGGDGTNWSAALVLSFPFFDGLATRGRVREAQSDLAQARLDVAQASDGVQVEVHSALEQLRVSAEIVRALSGTVGQAKRLLEMSRQGQELGVKTRLEVEDALLNVRQAEANLASAQRDYLVAQANLRYVEGLL
jgi:HAE1 family hydrophobic/amphiphilic exporter-1